MSMQQQWVAFLSIFRKEVRRFTRIWVQTLLPPAITMVLYFVIFGKLVGSRIGEMSGHSYIDFVAPGLIMMSVLTNSYANVSSSFFSAKFSRSVEELLVSPASNFVILMGFVMGGVARGLAVGAIVTAVALCFTQIHIEHPVLTAVVLLLTAITFSLAGFINAVYANSFDDVSIIPTFVLTPLTYLGGVFYSISLLGEFWQTLSLVNPILHMVNAFRFGFLGVSDTPIGWALVGLVALVAVLFAVSMWLLIKGKRLRA